MDKLIEKSERKLKFISAKHKRSLFTDIFWEDRLILLLGHRGTGKTTLMLQHLKSSNEKGIYLSLDDFIFEKTRLIHIFEGLYKEGFKRFYLDEVHRYLHWSKDLKQLYDDFEDVKIVATGSSLLDISKGNADLSRRAVTYTMQGLSFREYLLIEKNLDLPTLLIEQIINEHHQISEDLIDQFSWKTDFSNYLKYGYYPFFIENKRTYFHKLEQTAKLVIENDIVPFEGLNYKSIHSLKKLLFVISQSVPFIPNISKLAITLDLSRTNLLKLLDLLEQARLIKLLRAETKGVSYLQKPEKIYLENTNLIHLFAQDQPNIGSLRESFFYNQIDYKHNITSSKYADFMVDFKYTFEVGGANKSLKQIQGVPESYLALDIRAGQNKSIPLWLFGFLY
jgi:predicted AAA+ superfamily ATPase